MMIKERTLKHWIDNFYGYGSWHSRIWFVGYEEGGGDVPEEVAEKLNYFSNLHPSASQTVLCDIRDLYRHVAFRRTDGPKAGLYANLYEYRFDNKAVLHGSWKNLIAFVHGYQNKNLPDLLTYQKSSFALASANTEALLELYPLPAHNHAWYYSWLDLPQLSFLKSRESYQIQVYPDRINNILHNLNIYRPELVLMYGMDNINMLKKSVQDFFPDVTFKLVKATKRVIPQYHRADFKGTTILITTQIPALRHNRIETGFDWNAFGKSINPEI